MRHVIYVWLLTIYTATFFTMNGLDSDSSYQTFKKLFNDANNYFYQGDFQQAITTYYQALEIHRNYAPLHFNLGHAFAQAGMHEHAYTHFEEALRLNPSYKKAAIEKSTILVQQKRYAQAQATLHKALAQFSNDAELYALLGQAYYKEGHKEDAIKYYSQAHALDLHNTHYCMMLGFLYNSLGLSCQALPFYEHALVLLPNHPDILYNIAYTLRQKGKTEQAITYYERVIAQIPTHGQAHLGLAKAYLTVGNLTQGWQEFEWRWPNPQAYIAEFKHQHIAPEDLAHKRVFIRSEWGLGDHLHFIRYAKKLKECGAYVIVQALNPLISLFSLCPYIDMVVAEDAPMPAYDQQIPLLSLPLIFKTTLETIPHDIPYLYADSVLTASWQEYLSHDKNFKIGLCWQAKPFIFLEDHPLTKRSIPLQEFAPLFNLENVSIYSLQKLYADDQVAAHPELNLIQFPSSFDEDHGRYMDTAAVIKSLDLVISVDTSIVHLAGALGKTTWVLLPSNAEWRWLLDRNDSPWYPHVRLFRQHTSGDWASVINSLCSELETYKRSHGKD